MNVDLLLECRCTIGESPTWEPNEQSLYWIDVKAPALHRMGRDGKTRSWILADEIGAFALTDRAASAVVALRSGIFRLDLATGATTLLAPSPFDPNLFRFNEGICDAEGRFLIGVMFDPIQSHREAPRATQAMRRFTFRDGLVELPDRSDLHNGFAWSVNGEIFYWSHSYAYEILCASYDAETGRLGRAERFSGTERAGHLPDGAAMDEEGAYWCAIHGAGALRRYDSDGSVIAEIQLPVSQPTMCAFFGPNLDEMVVTSARDKLDSDQLKREPHAGGLFKLRPGVRGAPRLCLVR